MRSRSDAWVSAWPPSRPRPRTISSPPGKPPCACLELVDRGLGQRDQRALGDSRIAFGDFERIAAAVDQLDAEREAALVDQPPGAVERDVIGLAAHRIAENARRTRRPRRAACRSSTRRTAPRTAPAAAPSWSASAGAWARIFASSSASGGRASSRRKKLTPLDSRSTMSLRRLSAWSGSAPAAIAWSKPGSIASNACCAGRRAQRPRLARAPVGDMPRGRFGVGEPELAAARAQDVADRWTSRSRSSGARLSKSARRARHAGAGDRAARRRLARPCSRATLSSACGCAGSKWVCASSTICTRCSIGAQQPVGIGKLARPSLRPAAPAATQRLDRVESRRRAHRQDRGRRGSSAGSGRRTRLRGCRRGRA